MIRLIAGIAIEALLAITFIALLGGAFAWAFLHVKNMPNEWGRRG